MISKVLRTIIMGPPGSGKGTISHRIVKDFGMFHLSSGDLLRKQIHDKTEAGLSAKKYIDQGHLVPDDVMVDLIVNELHLIRSHNWLLDGFPRTVPQAKSLYEKEPVDVVINLNVPFDVIIHRIEGRWTHPKSGRIYHTEFNPPNVKGIDNETGEPLIQRRCGLDNETGEPLIQRDDDKPETVRKRLEQYQHLTEPVLHHFNDLGILKEFTGKYSNEIWPLIHEYLATKCVPHQYTHYD